jgi:hypothetical protein
MGCYPFCGLRCYVLCICDPVSAWVSRLLAAIQVRPPTTAVPHSRQLCTGNQQGEAARGGMASSSAMHGARRIHGLVRRRPVNPTAILHTTLGVFKARMCALPASGFCSIYVFTRHRFAGFYGQHLSSYRTSSRSLRCVRRYYMLVCMSYRRRAYSRRTATTTVCTSGGCVARRASSPPAPTTCVRMAGDTALCDRVQQRRRRRPQFVRHYQQRRQSRP